MKVVYPHIHHILLSTRQAPANHYGECCVGWGGGEDPQTGQKGHCDYPNNMFAKYRLTTLGRSKFKVG